MHLVFDCSALQDLQVSFAALFQRATTVKQFMWQPDLMRVAQFIDAGVRRMRETYPSDGSAIYSARLAGTDVISCLKTSLSCLVCHTRGEMVALRSLPMIRKP